MQDYTAPAYPTRDSLNGAKLRTMPGRWTKNAAVLAFIGALFFGLLTGCATPGVQPPASCNDGLHGVAAVYSQGSDFDVEIRAHFGGSAAGPFYVAYLTEQEALGIIRNRFCEAGICFDAPVPNDAAALAVSSWSTDITARLSLFDEHTRQGIVFPRPWDWRTPFASGMSHEEIENILRQQFAQQFHISATFMDNPGESMCNGEWQREHGVNIEPMFTEEEKQAAGALLEERLLRLVDIFIEQLRAEGVLP